MPGHFEPRDPACIICDLSDRGLGLSVEVDVLSGSTSGARDVVMMARQPLGQLVPRYAGTVVESLEYSAGREDTQRSIERGKRDGRFEQIVYLFGGAGTVDSNELLNDHSAGASRSHSGRSEPLLGQVHRGSALRGHGCDGTL